ncbi:MAG: PH domain-containing protein [Lachnospiraceae bacterium]|nr:PH domain-containing protein [Lachnospiraceae bacterium]MEE0686411.1 PH domain-containing protein [Lachnospiraceae bacterium]MEE0863127.1 PH domain-containing protein [Lachnospiraceae bacterium]
MGKSNLPVEKHEVKWKDRKRTIFGLPWSFTRYRLTDDKLIVSTGLFSLNEEEIRLYRIMDVTLKRSFGERLWGLGTIHICSSDKTTPELDIKRVRQSSDVKEMLSDMVEAARKKNRVSAREFMAADDMGDDMDEDDFH